MKSFRYTKIACYLGYVSQAVVNNFLPLLYVFFHAEYGISLLFLAMIGVGNFMVQLLMDVLSKPLIEKYGYRRVAILAAVCIFVGLLLLGILPRVLPPMLGLSLAVFVYAIGGGLDEVVISPIVESCPSKHKASQMAILHSMYCFGAFLVICLSTLFFVLFGLSFWWVLSFVWMIIPTICMVFFFFCPMEITGEKEKETTTRVKESGRNYLTLVLLIFAAGASEQAIAQWVSTYAELGLQVDKTLGDLFGAGLFAFTMGLSRLLYSFVSRKIALERILCFSASLCIVSYLFASMIPSSFWNFVGCILAGFSVGAMWPAVFSLAARKFPYGGAKLYSYLALGGDIGCGMGTFLIGSLGSVIELKYAILIGTIFPLCFLYFLGVWMKKKSTKEMVENE